MHQHIGLALVAPPTVEPVDLATAKLHLKVDTTDDDALITSLIAAARRACEAFTGLAFITQTWELWLDRAPSDRRGSPWWDGTREGPISLIEQPMRVLPIPKPPLQAANFAASTFALDNTETVFDSSSYIIDLKSRPGRMALNVGAVWPTGLRAVNAIKVSFQAGFGDTASSVPEDIKQAVLLLVGHLYENREAVTKDISPTELPLGVRTLLDSYKIVRL